MVIAAIVVVVLLIGGVALALLSGGGDETAGPPEASTNVDLKPGPLQVFWPGLGPTAVAPEATDQLMAAVGTYVDEGVVPTLRGKKLDTAALGEAFDEAAVARLSDATSIDRDALFDEGVPKAVGKLTISSPEIAMTALNDGEGKTVLVTANITLVAKGTNAKGKFTITHLGDLVAAPDASGTWKISGWTITVERKGAGFPAASTPDDPTATTTPTTPAETP
jgi:hypothetical protein